MKLIDIDEKSTLDHTDLVRRIRYKRIFMLYWALTIVSGVVIYGYSRLSGVAIGELPWGRVLGVHSVVRQSFDPSIVGAFIAASLFVSLALAITSSFYIPGGSEKVFLDLRSKVIFVTLGTLMFVATFIPIGVEHVISAKSGNSSSMLLYLGSSSMAGVVTIINLFFGFAQLGFFLCLRAAVTTSVEHKW